MLFILRQRRTVQILIAAAGIVMLSVLACVALGVTGLLLAPQVIDGETPTPAAVLGTPAPDSALAGQPGTPSTGMPESPPAEPGTALSPAAPAPTVAADDSLWVSPIDAPAPVVPVGQGLENPTTQGDAPLLIEPLDVPGPSDSLQLVATSQLTLSAVVFVENNGHLPAASRFSVRGAPGGRTWVADDALWITLLEPRTPAGLLTPGTADTDAPAARRGVMLKLTFPGANPLARPEPFDRLDTQVSFLSAARDPAQDASAAVWGGVRYTDLYPGIDLELSSEDGVYVQRLVAGPGADLSQVRLQVEGAQGVTVQSLPSAAGGEGYYLEVSTEIGLFALPLFRVSAASGSPVVAGPGLVQAPFTAVDGPGMPAIGAPPGLLHVSHAGTSADDEVRDVAVDAAGSAYLAGSSFFPSALQSPGPFDTATAGQFQAFALHLSPGGRALVYATFLGGSGDEMGTAIAVDGIGSAYLAGSTTSPDLPLALDVAQPGADQPFDTTYGQDEDIFLAKLDPTGRQLVYATYVGGEGREQAEDLAVDSTSSAYLAGWTESSDFPVTQGAWQTGHTGRSGFVVKVNAPGTGLAYATFLGGSGMDRAQAVAVDASGLAYVAGVTTSDDFPLTPGALDDTRGGESDAFVAIVNATGTAPLYATLLGGQADDGATGVAVDAAGTIHLGGYTRSADLPVSSWAARPTPGGGYDGFLARLDPAAGLLSGTFVGGSADDWVQAVAVDVNGRACAAGSTASTDLSPGRTGPTLVAAGPADAFVICFDNQGFAPTYAALLGGSDQERAGALAINRVGTTYVTTLSGNGSVVAKLVVGSPFLDLPVRYQNFGRAALGNVGARGPGRVNSWFDHNSPTHARNRSLTRWDGVTTQFGAAALSRIGESWYDGHGGIDFRWNTSREPVFAAAPGRVVDTVTNCRVGQQTCGGGFGNRVWIDHGNGFATVYAHLDTVDVAVGNIVVDPAAQQLGIMGNTGHSFGTHLHFALYFDANGDGQWKSDEVVDPYGWMGARSDPWRGNSQYLWRHTLFTQRIVGDTKLDPSAVAQTFMASPSQLVSITIPADAIGQPTLVELWDMPPATEPSANWRSTGRSFLLTGMALDTGAQAPAPGRPITLTMAIRQGDLGHLNPRQLALRRWDESSQRWEALDGRIDAQHNRVVAYTTQFGRFDLHAPLACPEDNLEPDDHYDSAQTIPADGSRLRRVLDVRDDVDWVRFEGQAGHTYLISARPLAAGLDLGFKIYDADSVRQLAASQAGQPIEWRAPTSGTYLVRIAPAGDDGPRGCDAAYEVSVGSLAAPQAVAITGPESGTVGGSYAFAASLTPVTITQPVTYRWSVLGTSESPLASGTTSTFSYTWGTADTYRLQVAVTNPAGTVTATHLIQILPAVEASFAASPITGPAPLQVKFEDTSVGNYTSRRWEFGDGQTGDGPAPTHTYTTPGTYTVTLEVDGDDGQDRVTLRALIIVQAAPTPPPARPHYDVRVYLPFLRR